MKSNVFSIEQFLKKKSLENEFVRNRRPLPSLVTKGKTAFESFYEVSENLAKFEQKMIDITNPC